MGTMEEWKKITLMTTVLAFLLEIRPLDPFLTAYLTGPDVNVPLDEVAEVLTPIRVYMGIVGTALCFLFADYVLYKPVLIVDGLVGIVMYYNFIGSPSKLQLWVSMALLSIYVCAELTCLSYVYVKIQDKLKYQTATGFIRSGTLCGTALSGLIGQVLVYFSGGRYTILPYISLVGVSLAFVWAWFLPAVKYSSFLQNVLEQPIDPVSSKTALDDGRTPKYVDSTIANQVKHNEPEQIPTRIKLFNRLLEDLSLSLSDQTVLKWSFWNTLALTGFMQVAVNINVLYTYNEDTTGDYRTLLNGMVEFVKTLSGAFCTYKIGFVNVDWDLYGDYFLGCGSLVLGVLMGLCNFIHNNYYVYIMYICYGVLFQSMVVIAQSQIAKNLKDDCYALVLGFSAFVAICIGTVFTMFVVSMNVFNTTVAQQFLFYGALYEFLGVVYLWNNFSNGKTVFRGWCCAKSYEDL
ncbi:thiamine transporter 1-like [Adelges cooleyi]|uniref:thiamine transporter 1-like n=1 Tax=Adelges cooleyi TaxID=133065 RepID=UPI0021806CBE|nr:thiamine transporter 1-like [Adelges cooleyi]